LTRLGDDGTKIIAFSEFSLFSIAFGSVDVDPPLTYSDIVLKLTNNLFHKIGREARVPD
jgi:hypothetical protein